MLYRHDKDRVQAEYSQDLDTAEARPGETPRVGFSLPEVGTFMTVFDVCSGVAGWSASRPARTRRDWVRGDVRCLMCGRLLGRLLGTTRTRENGDRTAGRPVAFVAYRPLNPPRRILPFSPELRFRCRSCGGAGALDEVEVVSTYDGPPPPCNGAR